MNIQKVGMGTCPVHGIAILQSLSEQGKGVCFACQEESKVKTGTTVVVTETSPDAKGKVTITDAKTGAEVVPTAFENEVIIRFTLDELTIENPLTVFLLKAHAEIDKLPVKTHGESKKLSAIQDHLIKLMQQNVPVREKRKYTKRDKSSTQKPNDESGTQTGLPN